MSLLRFLERRIAVDKIPVIPKKYFKNIRRVNDMFQIYEIKENVYNVLEEENRQDVIVLVKEIAENILEGEEVNETVAEEAAVKWFELHKNHIEEFAEELTEFAEALAVIIKRNRSKWIKK